MREAGATADLTRALKEGFLGFFVYCSKDTCLEVMSETVSKSRTAKHLCKAYGIPMEATISSGDNLNDIDTLSATGICFTMGNVPPEVKGQVRNMMEDSDHEGVLAGLEQSNLAENRI